MISTRSSSFLNFSLVQTLSQSPSSPYLSPESKHWKQSAFRYPHIFCSYLVQSTFFSSTKFNYSISVCIRSTVNIPNQIAFLSDFSLTSPVPNMPKLSTRTVFSAAWHFLNAPFLHLLMWMANNNNFSFPPGWAKKRPKMLLCITLASPYNKPHLNMHTSGAKIMSQGSPANSSAKITIMNKDDEGWQ